MTESHPKRLFGKESLGWSAPLLIYFCSGESHLWLLQLPGGEFSLPSCEIQQISHIPFSPAVCLQRPPRTDTCGPWGSPSWSSEEYLWHLGNHCLKGTLPLLWIKQLRWLMSPLECRGKVKASFLCSARLRPDWRLHLPYAERNAFFFRLAGLWLIHSSHISRQRFCWPQKLSHFNSGKLVILCPVLSGMDSLPFTCLFLLRCICSSGIRPGRRDGAGAQAC